MAQTIWPIHNTPAAIGTARAQVRLLVGVLFVGTVHWRPADHRFGVFSRVLSAGGGTNGIRKILAVCATYLVCAVEQAATDGIESIIPLSFQKGSVFFE